MTHDIWPHFLTKSAGDVVAQELKYHRACLTSLYNKERAHLRMKQSMTEDADAEAEINQIVFKTSKTSRPL
jgi:hypothetical protein